MPATLSLSTLAAGSGWTLTSIAGFSHAFSRAVESAVAIRESNAAGRRPPPAHLGHGLAQGLAGLAGGVAAGMTAVVRAPMQSYSSGSGMLGGIGRGLLGAVGLPMSGALELVGSTAEGLARSAGISPHALPRRQARVLLHWEAAPCWEVLPARLLQHRALAGMAGRYVEHALAEEATVLQVGGLRVRRPAPACSPRRGQLALPCHASIPRARSSASHTHLPPLPTT